MENLKILFITKLKKSQSNGVTVAVTQLLDSLSRYADVAFLDLNGFIFEHNERITYLNADNWDDFKPDIAVFEDPFNDLKFRKLAKILSKRQIPYIISPHGCFAKQALRKKAFKKFLGIHILFRKFLKGCIATQFLCDAEKNASLSFGDAIVIPNGIVPTNNYDIKASLKNIVFIGRKDVRHKGIDYLLQAINTIKSQLYDGGIKISLFGSIESEKDEDFINNFISKNNLSSVISNDGPVFGPEKESVLRKSDLFILTSRHEGLPMSVLEALSYGLPVLVTDGTNMSDLIFSSNSGWSCRTNVDSIVFALNAAINCHDFSSVSRNARLTSLSYSWDNVSKQTVETYISVIKKYEKNKK